MWEDGALVEEYDGAPRKKRRKWPKVAAMIAIIIIIILLLLRSCNGGRPVPEPGDGVSIGVIDEGNVPPTKSPLDPQTEVDGIVAENQFQVFINTRMEVLPDGHFEPLVQNSEANRYACWIEIVDGDEVLYSSDIVRPGYKIERDMLNGKLTRGRHDCQALFHVLKGEDMDSGEINTVNVNVVLVQK